MSSMRYHQNSHENWLHRPQEKYDGKTHSQMLNSLKKDNKKISLEMERCARGTNLSMYKDIKSMMKLAIVYLLR